MADARQNILILVSKKAKSDTWSIFFRLGVVLQMKIKSTKCRTWSFFRPAVVFDELSCSRKGFRREVVHRTNSEFKIDLYDEEVVTADRNRVKQNKTCTCTDVTTVTQRNIVAHSFFSVCLHHEHL